MRILILTQWFQPEPFFKGLPFARELQRRGHSVEVLTGFPNYPGGTLYPGYELRLYQREAIDGVPIVRVPLYPSHDGSAIRRIANYVSFAVAAVAVGTVLVRKPDVIYVYHPPATVGLPAMAISVLRGVPFVLDVQDLWPDSLAATGMLRNAVLLRVVGLWCRLVYALAAHITVLSAGFQAKLVERGVPPQKTTVIHNWCDESQMVSEASAGTLVRDRKLGGKFVVVFAGNMGKAQNLDAVLDAAAMLGARQPSVRFVLVGDGVETERLEARVLAERIDNVTFVPRQSVADVGKYLVLADLLLVHLRDDPLFRITIPSKTQAYMACGKPLVMAVAGDAAALVEEAGAGIACEPSSPPALADAVERVLAMSPEARTAMGERAKAFYAARLAMAAGVDRFERVFEGVAHG
ncbi:MAG: glycosyltransferase family 4 protein [Gemmatimonadaceae bacterium]